MQGLKDSRRSRAFGLVVLAVGLCPFAPSLGDTQKLDTSAATHALADFFAEAVFGHGPHAYSFSTNLAIVAARSVEDVGPWPLRHRGVCAAR